MIIDPAVAKLPMFDGTSSLIYGPTVGGSTHGSANTPVQLKVARYEPYYHLMLIHVNLIH